VVGVLGLSYKPDTAVVEESQGLALVERLLDLGRRVTAYDPKALPLAQRAVRRPFDAAASAADCVRAASLVVIMTPWPEFRDIPIEAFSRSSGRLTVIDCWRMIPPTVARVADVVYLGHGAAQRASVSA
jgi:UDPglucose 6-dehydrogenase